MNCPRCDRRTYREWDHWFCLIHGSFGFEYRAGDVTATPSVARHQSPCPRGPERCPTCREAQKGAVA